VATDPLQEEGALTILPPKAPSHCQQPETYQNKGEEVTRP